LRSPLFIIPTPHPFNPHRLYTTHKSAILRCKLIYNRFLPHPKPFSNVERGFQESQSALFRGYEGSV
jgi:hypothetical protein